MKKILTMACLAFSIGGMAQVKIGGPGSPNPRAVLELDGGTGKGLLLPRLTREQREAMTNVPLGLMVYQTDSTRGLYYNRSSSLFFPNWTYAAEGKNNWAANEVDERDIYNTNSGNTGIGVGDNMQASMKLHVETNDTNIALFSTNRMLTANVKAGIFIRTGNNYFGQYYTGAIKTVGTSAAGARIGLFTGASTNPNNLTENLSVLNNGNVGVGTTAPVIGGLVVDKKVGAVNAVFGSNTTGVAIESDYPGIGFNSYYDGGRKAINTGHGSLVGQDPATGNFYISTSTASATGQGTAMNTIDRLTIKPNGNIGIEGNTDPQVPLSFATSLGKKISLYRGPSGDAGFGVYGNELRLASDYNGADITFGYDNIASGFTEKMRIKGNGFMVLNNGRIRFNGQYSTGNASGIEFTKTGNNSASQGFIGMLDDNNLGLYGYGGAGWGLLYDVNDGAVKIGTTQKANGYKLNVGGKIIAEEVRVQLRSAWPDYVFSESYKLRSLNEVEKYITVNSHLPNVPAAADVQKSGIALGEMQTKMMEKIEELTLYVIALEKKYELLKKSINK